MPIITVSNASQLASALAAASAGDTISLAPGNYGDLSLRDKTFAAAVQIASADSANPAHFDSIVIENVDGLTFRSLDIGHGLAPGVPNWAKMVEVGNSSYITFDRVHFHGSLDGDPGNDANGVNVVNSTHIKVSNSEFQQLHRSFIVGSSTNIEVVDNIFHDLSGGGVHFAASQHVRIVGNRLSDFFPGPGAHPDAIQFWEVGTTVASSDILVMDNVILQGRGQSTQGIFFGDDVGTLDYTNVRIANNLVYVDGYNGLTLRGGVNVSIEGNTVVSKTTDGFLNRIMFENVKGGTLRSNVADVIITGGNSSVQSQGNVALRDEPGRAAQIRDLDAAAGATVQGLLLPGIGYRPPPEAARDAPLYGLIGNETFYLGSAFNSSTRIYAAGADNKLVLQGSYSGVVMGPHSLANISTLSILSGTDTRYGDASGSYYGYSIAAIDANVAAGQRLVVDSQLRAGEYLQFNGSAETDGSFLFYGSRGQESFVGGAQNDIFVFGDGRFSLADALNGGGGDDQLILQGSLSVAFGAHSLADVETLSILSGTDTRYGDVSGSYYGYSIASADANIAAGQRLVVNSQLRPGEYLQFNGSAETDGSFLFYGSRGQESLTGGAGSDSFVFGAGRFSLADGIDGGAGNDELFLQGSTSLALGAHSLVNIETLSILTGMDARFGDTSGSYYGYSLASVDANVAAGQRLIVDSQLRPGEYLQFNGSAETDGSFQFNGSRGMDILAGGAGNDDFVFGNGRLGLTDALNGGAGDDQLILQGSYSLALGAHSLANIEKLTLLSGADNRFGDVSGSYYGYGIASADANVAAGQRLVIDSQLRPGEYLLFNGSAETDGSFLFKGGRGLDIFVGGHCDDIIFGGLGADSLAGGDGADTFGYNAAAESTGLSFDQIIGFDCRNDKIDLATDISGFSQVLSAGVLSAASFEVDLALALAGLLGAGEATLLTAGAGDLAGRTFAVVDGNGIAGYQAGEDYVIEFVAPAVPIAAGADFFV